MYMALISVDRKIRVETSLENVQLKHDNSLTLAFDVLYENEADQNACISGVPDLTERLAPATGR
jgi:hypothetical protein